MGHSQEAQKAWCIFQHRFSGSGSAVDGGKGCEIASSFHLFQGVKTEYCRRGILKEDTQSHVHLKESLKRLIIHLHPKVV